MAPLLWAETEMKRFAGKWTIVEMEAWDQDYVNMEVAGHFTFKMDGMGHFQFGLVQGWMDCRMETGCGKERIKFSWEGNFRDGPCKRPWLGRDRKGRNARPNFLPSGGRFHVPRQEVR